MILIWKINDIISKSINFRPWRAFLRVDKIGNYYILVVWALWFWSKMCPEKCPEYGLFSRRSGWHAVLRISAFWGLECAGCVPTAHEAQISKRKLQTEIWASRNSHLSRNIFHLLIVNFIIEIIFLRRAGNSWFKLEFFPEAAHAC